MSRAFTKEIDELPDLEEPLPLRPRDPSPITAEGHAALVSAWDAHVVAETTATRPARILKLVIDTVVVVAADPVGDDVSFGCAVVVEHEDGREKRYTLVGPDEADPASGAVAVGAPLGRALLGSSVGDDVVLEKPAGEEVLRIIAVERPT